MKKLAVLFAFMAFISCGVTHKASETVSSETEFRLGTYNVWISKIGKGDYAWDVLKNRLAQSVAYLDMDVFGIQEVDLRIQE